MSSITPLEQFFMEEAAAAYVIADIAEQRQIDMRGRMEILGTAMRNVQTQARRQRRELRQLRAQQLAYQDANNDLAIENQRLDSALRHLTTTLDRYRAAGLNQMRMRRIPPALVPYIHRRRQASPPIQPEPESEESDTTDGTDTDMEGPI